MVGKKILGIITARGGSKGIPGKNIKLLFGKPLIAYTIETAKKSGVFDRLILSTDDEAIANVAREYGCEVPFMRPAELAQDATPHLPVIQHAVAWLREHESYQPDFVMILQPTSPLRQAFHIKEAAELMLQKEPDSVLSVAPIPEHFNSKKAMVLGEDGRLTLLSGDPIYKRVPRHQDLGKEYRSAGMIYLFKTALVLDKENPNFYGERTLPYIVEEKYLADIDHPEDWEAAEQALTKLTESK
ncbi:MAG TPA: acylneuraminate cytidylyltransferase family protein [Candidatus Paceibacterota bacterium]